ncbi:MAG TPA: HAMP domain-containing sensor histidine kinase [Streptosporangiaceae bacterium]|nr:HAMP domain-containing sensor histidine kinase [Streptosporangiaceae bacterium]
MSGSRKLSLRARMLVLLIGVTTMFLLIMGMVSTIVLARNVTRQFKSSLVAESTHSPADIGQHPNGYAAVLITRRPLSIRPLTGYTATTAALAAAVTSLMQRAAQGAQGAQGALGALRDYAGSGSLAGHAFDLPAADGARLVAAARVVSRKASGGPGVLVVAQPASAATGQVRRFIIAELITGGALIALLAIGGEWLIGRGLDPLGQMASTAHDITSRGDLTARMPEADDQTEVGLLGTAINTMLDRIQQAFGARLRSEQKVREFAADASHELRTPLTTIRGYAELYRQGALGPDQLPNAMRRIEQEAQRMSMLVAELLELARLDRTTSLDLTEADLAGIVRDAVADAAAVEPRRPVRAEAPPRLVAVVDEPRIRQVLANLLANVRAHTPVAAPVAVRLGTITGGILLEVADGGPGMSDEDAARAFDRFHRAAERGDGDGDGDARDARGGLRSGGSGLGLSIVQAIAHAHGGRATLESRLGHGTKVRVWLPARTIW